MQNGTKASNAALVKLLNEATVPASVGALRWDRGALSPRVG
jgi:hypothetical protein